MRSFQRFVSRHRWVMPVFFTAAAIVYAYIFADLGLSPWWAMVLLPFIMISFFMGSSVSSALQLPAIKALDEACDPYPLLDETTVQLTYVKNKQDRATLTLNHTAALIELGQAGKARALLATVCHADLPPLPTAWLAYNVNMAMAELQATGDFARAQVFYEQGCPLPERVKNPKQQAIMTDSLRLLYAELLLAQGEAGAALPVVNAIADTGPRMQVSKAWAYARIALATGDTETARQNLAYVLAHGNRLYVVQHARALMETL